MQHSLLHLLPLDQHGLAVVFLSQQEGLENIGRRLVKTGRTDDTQVDGITGKGSVQVGALWGVPGRRASHLAADPHADGPGHDAI